MFPSCDFVPFVVKIFDPLQHPTITQRGMTEAVYYGSSPERK